MRKPSSGFTLIELVVVITVLGILAAFALPRFASLQTEARIAKMQAAMGSIKSAAAMAHALQLTQQKDADATVKMEGVDVSMKNGYPTAKDIVLAAGLINEERKATEGYVIVSVSGNAAEKQRIIRIDASRSACAIIYTEAKDGFAPTYDSTGLTLENCD